MALTRKQQNIASLNAARAAGGTIAAPSAKNSGGGGGGGGGSASVDNFSRPILTPEDSGGGGLSQEQMDAQSVIGRVGEEAAAESLKNDPGLNFPTRNSGESDAAYADRIRATPFALAGGPVGGGSSYSSFSAPSSSVNRPIFNTKFGQNSLSGAGFGSASPEEDFRSDEEKDAEDFLNTSFSKPKTEEEIIQERTDAAKGTITSLNDFYDSQLKDRAEINKQREAETNAQSVLSGLMGSSEAGNRLIDAKEKGAQANKGIQAERNMKLQQIYTDIQNNARTEAKDLRDEARLSAQDILTRSEAKRVKAVEDIKILAGAGFDLEAVRTKDPQTYESLVRSVGSEEKVKALMVLNRPQDTIVDKKFENGKFISVYRNPITGKIKIETADIGVPEGAKYQANFKGEDGNNYIVYEQGGKIVTQKVVGSGTPTPRDPITAEYGTPEYATQLIKDSVKYGDKRLLQDERKNITAAKRALGSLDIYNQILDGTLDKSTSKEVFGDGTGVIKGRLRTLASQWGGDPNAAAINATIQGIIPTVARGIFQEVGVLTDQDIANYKKVVPDINKPENANKLIQLVLLKTLERTYADTLITAAQNQTNVSNFLLEYQDVVQRIQKMTGEDQSDTVNIRKPDGTTGTIPRASLQKALDLGAEQI